jgi:predicted MPP superfamily phosphohydrolase
MQELLSSSTARLLQLARPFQEENHMSGINTRYTMKKTISRRHFLFKLLGTAGIIAGGVGYAHCVEPFHPQISRTTLRWEKLPPELAGMTFVQLTDIHHSNVVGRAYIRKCVDTVNSLRPDIIFLTGDYVTHSPEYIKPCVEELSRLSAPSGVFAVPGNHDYWTDIDLMSKCLDDAGIHLLVNRSCTAAVRGKELAIVGLDDLWAGMPNIRKAFNDVPAGAKKVLLMHNPDLIEDLSEQRTDIILAGHTHGGQVCLPFLGSLVTPSRFGSKYSKGLITKDGTAMYVNRGVGLVIPAVRFLCPPEIAHFTVLGT